MLKIKFIHYETSGKIDNPPAIRDAEEYLTERIADETGNGETLQSISLVNAEYDKEQKQTSMLLMLVCRKPAS